MEMTEFFVSRDEVWYTSPEGMQPLREGSPVVQPLLEKIREFYPMAYDALTQCYSKSQLNKPYFDFLRARRFCKCNFGSLDHTRKDMDGAIFNFERVPCPLVGECPYECVICMPKMETQLSDAEKRVMLLVSEGRSNTEIAEELYLSPNTVKRHISVSFIKTRTRNRAEFVKFAKDNNLFNNQ